ADVETRDTNVAALVNDKETALEKVVVLQRQLTACQDEVSARDTSVSHVLDIEHELRERQALHDTLVADLDVANVVSLF
ncbi:hypothetical protein K525DRAFT_275780, partial [Schizophyllum commune Loenen D]